VVQDEAEAAGFAGGESEPPRCREIGLLAREFGHHHAGGTAFERFLHGPQGIARAWYAQDDKALRGQAHEIETRPVKSTRLGSDEIGLDPHRLPTRPQRQRREGHRESHRGAAMGWGRGSDLMQGPAGEPAGKRPIDGGDAKAYEPAALIRQGCREIGDGAP
jgi:hypothetical protein